MTLADRQLHCINQLLILIETSNLRSEQRLIGVFITNAHCLLAVGYWMRYGRLRCDSQSFAFPCHRSATSSACARTSDDD